MFDYLVKILLESDMPLPEFWEDRKPEEGQALDFEDNSDDEEDGEVAGGNGGDAAADSW